MHLKRRCRKTLTLNFWALFFPLFCINRLMDWEQRKEKRREIWNRHSTRHAAALLLQRNMRSKFRWFTELCNSHYVSQFAAFFIGTRAKRSTVESRRLLFERFFFGLFLCFSPRRKRKKGGLSKKSLWQLRFVLYFWFGGWKLWVKERQRGFYVCFPRKTSTIKPHTRLKVHSRFGMYFLVKSTLMILPQVHLRKPCYDFSFL